MTKQRLVVGGIGLLIAASIFTAPARAGTETVLRRFQGITFPQGSVISDAAGNLYRTTTGAGSGARGVHIT